MDYVIDEFRVRRSPPDSDLQRAIDNAVDELVPKRDLFGEGFTIDFWVNFKDGVWHNIVKTDTQLFIDGKEGEWNFPITMEVLLEGVKRNFIGAI
jgi:hypothetical protein